MSDSTTPRIHLYCDAYEPGVETFCKLYLNYSVRDGDDFVKFEEVGRVTCKKCLSIGRDLGSACSARITEIGLADD